RSRGCSPALPPPAADPRLLQPEPRALDPLFQAPGLAPGDLPDAEPAGADASLRRLSPADRRRVDRAGDRDRRGACGGLTLLRSERHRPGGDARERALLAWEAHELKSQRQPVAL